MVNHVNPMEEKKLLEREGRSGGEERCMFQYVTLFKEQFNLKR